MKKRRVYMTVNVRAGLVSTKELEDMQRGGNLKLLTSKQLAKIINLKSDAALRKQRSKGRSLFPYTRVGRKIFYPANLIVKTLQQNMVDANLR